MIQYLRNWNSHILNSVGIETDEIVSIFRIGRLKD